ncbi:MAG: hypothetical protein HY200_08120 [Nitrospirae bacterium]|nr:hypothetical protein [Nitrospirota bacterium]MBI3594911.1 hypothetical protein [Nitrospirota bacterium]
MLFRFRITVLIFLFTLTLVLPVIPVSGKVIDQILAVVNDHLITESDLRIQKRFSLEFPLLEEEGKDTHLQFAIDQVLLLEDAEKFATEKPEESEITAWLKKIELAAGGAENLLVQLSEEGINQSELRQKISNTLLSKKFIEQRINYFIFISDNEINAYYQDHLTSWNGSALENVKSQIYANLFEQKRKTKLEEFLIKRRSRSTIRVSPPYSSDVRQNNFYSPTNSLRHVVQIRV